MKQYVSVEALRPAVPTLKLSPQGAAAFESAVRHATNAINTFTLGVRAIAPHLDMAATMLQRKPNGVRVVHAKTFKDFHWDLGNRWHSVYGAEPVRVRTCRGSRR